MNATDGNVLPRRLSGCRRIAKIWRFSRGNGARGVARSASAERASCDESLRGCGESWRRKRGNARPARTTEHCRDRYRNINCRQRRLVDSADRMPSGSVTPMLLLLLPDRDHCGVSVLSRWRRARAREDSRAEWSVGRLDDNRLAVWLTDGV